MSSPEPDSVALNRERWTVRNAEWTDARSAAAWARDEITWGMFNVPDSEVGVLGDVAELDVVELGCGTAYFSAWLAKRGARPVGVDPTPAQLETARRLQRETGIEFPLVEAPGEAVPLPDASFDLVHSEHGASTWADPYKWIPEAARLLRPRGRLVFLHSTPLAIICFPPTGEITTELKQPYHGLYRSEWDGGVEFQLTHGDWVRVLRRAGFEILDLIELRPPAEATTHPYYNDIPVEWVRQWPAEEIWVARKR
jgi:ubiquinone/menaquinone biosynthesis C-methylase UbiE